MDQLASKSKREKGQYRTLPLMNADKSGSAQIAPNFKIQDLPSTKPIRAYPR
jgi:hypothetical protein